MKVFVYCSLSKKSKKRCLTLLETANKTENTLYKEFDFFFLGGGGGGGGGVLFFFGGGGGGVVGGIFDFLKGVNPLF